MRAFALLASTALPWSAVAGSGFDDYLRRFGKVYHGEEYAERQALYERRLAEVNAHNAQQQRTWTAAVNELTDLRASELKSRLGYNKHMARSTGAGGFGGQVMAMSRVISADVPDHVDWREHEPSVVTPVKAQGSCGSCWAFSAAESMESHIALETGVLLSISPQQLNSCTPNPQHCGGHGGCTGATAQLAFNYTIQAGGVTDIWHSPYLSGITQETGECKVNYWQFLATITGFEELPRNEAAPLMAAVATKGPVSVSVDAGSWFPYAEGVFSGCDDRWDINHAVQLMGYGQTADGTKYWLVRNSWGPTWGEDGYIRLKRHDEEPCGLDTMPQDGFGCEGGPPNITVCGECGVLSDSSLPTGGKMLTGGRRLFANAADPLHV